MNKFYDWLQLAIIALYAVLSVGIVLFFVINDAKAHPVNQGECYEVGHFVADTVAKNANLNVEAFVVEDIVGTAANEFAIGTGWPASDGYISRAILFAGIVDGNLSPLGVIVLFTPHNGSVCAVGSRQFLIEKAGPIMKQLREKYSG